MCVSDGFAAPTSRPKPLSSLFELGLNHIFRLSSFAAFLAGLLVADPELNIG